MNTFIALLISFVLSTYGGPNVNSDHIFEQAINDGAIPYETLIPWSTDHYLSLMTLPEQKQVEEQTTEATTEEVVVQEPTTSAGDLGILSIPDAGIYVGLYSDANAFQSSGKASVQYYTQYGIKWIADHVNQDSFGNLKNISIGSKVYINDTEYTVVDNVYAPDYYTNFASWVSYIEESPLVIQTCEGDGARLVRCQ